MLAAQGLLWPSSHTLQLVLPVMTVAELPSKEDSGHASINVHAYSLCLEEKGAESVNFYAEFNVAAGPHSCTAK